MMEDLTRTTGARARAIMARYRGLRILRWTLFWLLLALLLTLVIAALPKLGMAYVEQTPGQPDGVGWSHSLFYDIYVLFGFKDTWTGPPDPGALEIHERLVESGAYRPWRSFLLLLPVGLFLLAAFGPQSDGDGEGRGEGADCETETEYGGSP